MRKTTLSPLTTGLVLALASPVAAQRGGSPAAVDPEFTFADTDDLEGRRIGAEGVIAPGRTRLRRTCFVHERTHFVPEMLETVETL